MAALNPFSKSGGGGGGDEAQQPAACSVIVPELAALGVYAQSVKPSDDSWFGPGGLVNGLHHHLINVSESGLAKHLPAYAAAIVRHNAHHLMRVYPKGTRISSSNLKPVAFWATGAQICALNWQSFGTSNQLNDALFSGSDGYVLKPAALRAGGDGRVGTGRRKRLRLHVAGATGIPLHEDREAESIRTYLTCNLYSPCAVEGDGIKRKTSPYKHHHHHHHHHRLGCRAGARTRRRWTRCGTRRSSGCTRTTSSSSCACSSRATTHGPRTPCSPRPPCASSTSSRAGPWST